MKTKNIVLSVLAFALVATPLLAQDFHENEYKKDMGKINDSVAQTYKNQVEEQNKEKYLDVGTLSNYLLEDLPIDLEKLLTKATNSINDNKITPQEQYDLMIACVEHNEYEVLETLLKAGFDPKINAVDSNYPLFEKSVELGYQDIALLILEHISKTHVKATEFIHYTKGMTTKEMPDVADDFADKDIVAAYYYTSSGMLVIKQWKNPISEQEFQTWLENNESMRMTNNAAMRQSIDNEIKHKINLFKTIQMNSPFVPGNPKLNFKPKSIDTLK